MYAITLANIGCLWEEQRPAWEARVRDVAIMDAEEEAKRKAASEKRKGRARANLAAKIEAEHVKEAVSA